MHAPIVYIPLAIEWVILITAFMPRLLAGMFYNVPRFGLTLWFVYLVSSIVASGAAIIIAGWALVEFFERSWGADSIELELLNHLGLWVLVAITGIMLSLINLRAEPLVTEAHIARTDLAQTSRVTGRFEGVEIRQLTFPLPLAFVTKVERKQTILVSDSASLAMSEAELDAMYWHELGHIRGRHNLLNGIVKFVALLTPMLSASRTFTIEARQLTELMADNYAKRHASEEALRSAREKFLE